MFTFAAGSLYAVTIIADIAKAIIILCTGLPVNFFTSIGPISRAVTNITIITAIIGVCRCIDATTGATLFASAASAFYAMVIVANIAFAHGVWKVILTQEESLQTCFAVDAFFRTLAVAVAISGYTIAVASTLGQASCFFIVTF